MRRPAAVGAVNAPVRVRDAYVRRANPLVAAWRWRYELLAVAAIGAGGWTVAAGRVPVWVLVVLGQVAAAVAVVPWLRRRVAARVRAVVIAHRVRVGCAEGGVHTGLGRLPVVYRVTPRAYGERVRLWCLGAVGAEDFRDARDVLATACWADEVRVVAHPRCRQLVTLYAVRRTVREEDRDTGAVRVVA